MITPEKNIDQLIAESLSKDEAAFYDQLEEQGLFESIFELYRGKLGFITLIMTIVSVVVAVITFYAGYYFFTAESVELMMYYGGIMFLSFLFVSMIKIWHWLQMSRNSVIREIKRVEYQIALLMEKAGSSKEG